MRDSKIAHLRILMWRFGKARSYIPQYPMFLQIRTEFWRNISLRYYC
jgi:hypothetical protein